MILSMIRVTVIWCSVFQAATLLVCVWQIDRHQNNWQTAAARAPPTGLCQSSRLYRTVFIRRLRLLGCHLSRDWRCPDSWRGWEPGCKGTLGRDRSVSCCLKVENEPCDLGSRLNLGWTWSRGYRHPASVAPGLGIEARVVFGWYWKLVSDFWSYSFFCSFSLQPKVPDPNKTLLNRRITSQYNTYSPSPHKGDWPARQPTAASLKGKQPER